MVQKESGNEGLLYFPVQLKREEGQAERRERELREREGERARVKERERRDVVRGVCKGEN